jgi:hypothetical protein
MQRHSINSEKAKEKFSAATALSMQGAGPAYEISRLEQP